MQTDSSALSGTTEMESRLNDLASAVGSGSSASIDAFWQAVIKEGSPSVHDLGNGSVRVTLVWRGSEQAQNVALVGWSFEALSRIPGTDVWHLTTEVPADITASYGFAENASQEFNWPDYFRAQPDPLNPRRFSIPADEQLGLPELPRSVLELPGSAPQPWIEVRDGVPHGSVDHHRIRSEILDSERDAWVYRPPQDPQGLLVLLDGRFYIDAVPVPTILDNMVAEGVLPPLLAVMVGASTLMARNEEANCSEFFTDFLAGELVPWAGEHRAVTVPAERAIVGGKSACGLAALYAAYRRPDTFGNALAQSPTLHWKRDGQTLNERIRSADRVPTRSYHEAGTYEQWGPDQDFVGLCRELSGVIAGKGGEVRFAPFVGGHDPLVWRGTISDALTFLCEEWER